jgi:hypothetical protein
MWEWTESGGKVWVPLGVGGVESVAQALEVCEDIFWAHCEKQLQVHGRQVVGGQLHDLWGPTAWCSLPPPPPLSGPTTFSLLGPTRPPETPPPNTHTGGQDAILLA